MEDLNQNQAAAFTPPIETGGAAVEPESPQDEAVPAIDELAEARAKADEYLAGWKRAMADYANLKKETERQREEFVKYAYAGLAFELLPALDAFKKAAASEPKIEDANVAAWVQGVSRIRQQLDGVMKKIGLTAIEEINVAFDPAIHEAMMTRKEEDIESGQVIQILETGYRLHDKILRPAKVAVSE